ncbi:MAG: hypothetical protein J5752_02930 [Clostridiales bacterium]|nr:hypothetical protein [Clostridiales bacterium]
MSGEKERKERIREKRQFIPVFEQIEAGMKLFLQYQGLRIIMRRADIIKKRKGRA